MTAEVLNARLVAQLKEAHALRQPATEQALLATPRHLFIPHVSLEEAYQDRAIPTKMQDEMAISSCSQPAIIAIMLEQLAVHQGMNVLEIGAGTGYNAALLAHLVGPTGRVTTMDIDDDIVQHAQAPLQAVGVTNVNVVCADGGLGYAERAPYDRIILTVAAWDISPTWVEQLKPSGVLLLPLVIGARQFSIAFEKVNDHLQSRTMQLCGFMALRGSFAGTRLWLRVGDFMLGGDAVARLAADRLRSLFEGQPQTRELATEEFPLGDLVDDLGAHGELVFTIFTDKQTHGFSMGYGLCSPAMDSAVVLLSKDRSACEPMRQVLLYGDESAWSLLDEKLSHFIEANKPSLSHGRVVVHPLGHAPTNQLILRKRWMEYALMPAHVV